MRLVFKKSEYYTIIAIRYGRNIAVVSKNDPDGDTWYAHYVDPETSKIRSSLFPSREEAEHHVLSEWVFE